MQQAFVDQFAVQCGFCIPGFLLSAERLSTSGPVPSAARTSALGLSGNLCRCTGYYSFIDAVEQAARRPGRAAAPTSIGRRPPARVDAVAKGTTGPPATRPTCPPTPDAKVVFSGRPHARMLAMDMTAAPTAPGVVAVFTAADVPVNEYGLTMRDQPVLVGLGDTGRSAVAVRRQPVGGRPHRARGGRVGRGGRTGRERSGSHGRRSPSCPTSTPRSAARCSSGPT